MRITDAFRTLGATQTNVQWGISGFNAANELVISLWEKYFERTGPGTLVYRDHVTRTQSPGMTELARNLDRAVTDGLLVRAIVVRMADGGEIASEGRKTFSPKPDWIGKITHWDGEWFHIEFHRA